MSFVSCAHEPISEVDLELIKEMKQSQFHMLEGNEVEQMKRLQLQGNPLGGMTHKNEHGFTPMSMSGRFHH